MHNPLQRLGSLKVKLSVVIVAAVVVTLAVNEIGLKLNFRAGFRAFIAAAIALLMVQLLAGMTSPLREMEQAATRMADGDYTQIVISPSADEVGRLAIAFNHMAAELAELDRQRRDLIANVSHELRTPISALRATLENVVDGVVPASPDLLGTMLSQTERLQRLVTQLLDLSRLESGGSPLHPTLFRVAELLVQVADEAAPPPAWPAVHGVRRARGPGGGRRPRAAPPGGRQPRRERFALLAGAGRGAAAQPRVPRAHSDRGADEGPGIDEADSERIFERFYRPDAARTSDDGGAGLGLSIARWIVDLHGGTIRAERRQPHGARLVVELPAPTTPADAGRLRPACWTAPVRATRPPGAHCSLSPATTDPTPTGGSDDRCHPRARRRPR